ncbi:MAG: hypothetical protein C0404_12940 [Verrucomicrobia bacterium]|nr:hypothetical protein [Verrucomicrobiota bacterium]
MWPFQKTKRYDWKKEQTRLWAELVPGTGQADTLQGELIRIAGKLTDQAYRNGNCNWDEEHESMWRFIGVKIADDPIFTAQEQALIKEKIEEIIRDQERPDLSGDGSPYYFISEKVVDWCMAHPNPIPIPNKEGSAANRSEDATKLLIAAGQGDLALVKALMARGMSVNAVNDLGYTPLMSACASYRAEMVSFLLQSGADVKATTTDGRTALHAAVSSTPSLPKQQAECVRLLIRQGAEIDAQDKTGGTPLMSAAWFGCTMAVKELLRHGAATSLRDTQGRTAKDLALVKNRIEIIELVKQTK